MITMAPIGAGCTMIPIIVVVNIANKCHALESMRSECGQNQIPRRINVKSTSDKKRLCLFMAPYNFIWIKTMTQKEIFLTISPSLLKCR
ncbi:Uncharacterised protein [Chlamydia trachomatis]|nr:Uncharacterised protein [Chlamydia trachomatis]CRH47703.1 Uncharacterised protein [Chlamydia trachomatis]